MSYRAVRSKIQNGDCLPYWNYYLVIADHPRSLLVDRELIFKFYVDRVSIFEDIVIREFRAAKHFIFIAHDAAVAAIVFTVRYSDHSGFFVDKVYCCGFKDSPRMGYPLVETRNFDSSTAKLGFSTTASSRNCPGLLQQRSTTGNGCQTRNTYITSVTMRH